MTAHPGSPLCLPPVRGHWDETAGWCRRDAQVGRSVARGPPSEGPSAPSPQHTHTGQPSRRPAPSTAGKARPSTQGPAPRARPRAQTPGDFLPAVGRWGTAGQAALPGRAASQPRARSCSPWASRGQALPHSCRWAFTMALGSSGAAAAPRAGSRSSQHRRGLPWTGGSGRTRLLKLAPPGKAGARREAPDPSLPPPSPHPYPIASSTNLTLDPGSWLGLPSSGSGLSHWPRDVCHVPSGGGGQGARGHGAVQRVGAGSQGRGACLPPSTRVFLQERCRLPPEPGHSQARRLTPRTRPAQPLLRLPGVLPQQVPGVGLPAGRGLGRSPTRPHNRRGPRNPSP